MYCHPQTDCFIVLQLFSVARHTEELQYNETVCLWMTIHTYIYIYIYIFIYISSLSVDDNTYIYVCIVIHRQIVSLYRNSSVWLDTLDASSLD